MAIALLVAGLVLSWGLGIALLAALSVRANPPADAGEFSWRIGCGWFVGIFLITLWMRALSALGVAFGIVTIGGPIAVATAALGWFAWRRRGTGIASSVRAVGRLIAGADLASWRRVLWLGLIGWLALRFAMLLGEVCWRPLYPWDAWLQWATKARVWFELKAFVPFVTGPDWFRAGTAAVYYDPAPHYPATVPLFQVWSAILLGRWDDVLVNLPWWLTGVAFALAVFGSLRRWQFDTLAALAGTWLVVSLPILDTHVALAGYADLPMSTYFTLAAIATMRAIDTRRASDAIVALLLLVACTLIKNPGIVWVATLVPGVIVALLGRTGLRIAAIGLGVSVFGVLVLAQSDVVLLGYRLHLDFDPPVRALVASYFMLGNWHLLWYGAIAVALLGYRQLLTKDNAPFTMVVIAGVGFLLFGFVFTNARQWVEDQSTVNRATLHLAPLAAIWMLLVFRGWASEAPRGRVAVTAHADARA